MLKKILTIGFIGLIFVVIHGCSKRDEAKKIDLNKREPDKVISVNNTQKPLRIAVGSIITPRAGFAFYRKLIEYIGEKLDRPVKLVDRESYSDINKLIKFGDLDVAFVCGRPYVDGHEEFGMELLVAPEVSGKTVYYSYIIVARDSPIENFEGLRGKSFAFTDPMSNTGKLVPAYMLAGMRETPDSYFKNYIYTYAHDKSIKAVAQGIVDGAAVDSLVWEYVHSSTPELTSKTRIIAKSPPHGITPVVVPKGLDPELKKKIKHILLNIHEDERGKKIINRMMIDRFVVVDDSQYDSIREMKSFVAGQETEEVKLQQ
jgi:phosphonate transport system substrate-binding protein